MLGMRGVVIWAAAWLLAMPASAATLTVLLDDSSEMPLALIRNGELQDGIKRDLGYDLAARLGREARFLVLPRKRLTAALSSGQADLLCLALPEWLPGPFDWSQPFLRNEDVLLTLKSLPEPHHPADLKGEAVGTLLGYAYPELERELGGTDWRDDARTALDNLHKLQAGHLGHVVIARQFLEYQLAHGLRLPPLHPWLAVAEYNTRCAVSRKGQVTLAEVNHAISLLQSSGGLSRLLQHYR